MEVTALVAAQEEAVFTARAPVQVEEDFTVRAILVTKEDIINNPAKVISSNNPDIRASQNS